MSKALDDLLYGGINIYIKGYGDCTAYVQDYINIIEKELREKEELEKENKRLANALKKKKGKLRHYATIKKENQELSETLQLYNEKFAGFERVKADLMKENQELKDNIDSDVDFLNKEVFRQQERNIDLGIKYAKLKKVIEILLGENGAVLLGSDNKHKLHLVDYELVKYFISKEKYNLLREELTDEVND